MDNNESSENIVVSNESHEGKIRKLIGSPNYSRTVGVLIVLLIALMVPLTVTISERQTQTQQSASGVTPPVSLPAAAQIPEREGLYDDPGNPGIKVRVHVYDVNPAEKRRLETQVAATCEDLDSTVVDTKAQWHLPSGVWAYNVNASSAPGSLKKNVQAIVTNAFNTWNIALATSSPKPVFVQGVNTSLTKSALDGQNVIAWGRLSNLSIGITYVRYNGSNGVVADVDTILNNRNPWSFTSYTLNGCGDANSYDAQNVITHEIGHWLGLEDKYDVSYNNNTMYGYGAIGEIKKDTLTNGDVVGVKAIYP